MYLFCFRSAVTVCGIFICFATFAILPGLNEVAAQASDQYRVSDRKDRSYDVLPALDLLKTIQIGQFRTINNRRTYSAVGPANQLLLCNQSRIPDTKGNAPFDESCIDGPAADYASNQC